MTCKAPQPPPAGAKKPPPPPPPPPKRTIREDFKVVYIIKETLK